MPPTHKAVKSIAGLFERSLGISEIVETIGSEAFKMIAETIDKKGRTLLHYYAQHNEFNLQDYQLLLNAKSISSISQEKDRNAATIAFRHGSCRCWDQLVSDGSVIQTDKMYYNLVWFLRSLFRKDISIPNAARFVTMCS